jgi:hypothetical protein
MAVRFQIVCCELVICSSADVTVAEMTSMTPVATSSSINENPRSDPRAVSSAGSKRAWPAFLNGISVP